MRKHVFIFTLIVLFVTTSLASCTLSYSSQPDDVFVTPMLTQVLPALEEPVLDFTLPALASPVQIAEDPRLPYTGNKTVDIYYPENGGDWPVVVALSGGSAGARSLANLARAIAGQGAVVFVPTYFSSPPPADQIDIGPGEAACAVRFALANATRYGGDPERLILVGHSAGGAFGAVLMFAASDFQSSGCAVPESDFSPDGFIGLDGAYDLTRYVPEETLREGAEADWLRINPFTYVHSVPVRDNVRFILIAGLVTELRQQAQLFEDALSAVGYPVLRLDLPGVDHSEIIDSSIEEVNRAVRMLLDQ